MSLGTGVVEFGLPCLERRIHRAARYCASPSSVVRPQSSTCGTFAKTAKTKKRPGRNTSDLRVPGAWNLRLPHTAHRPPTDRSVRLPRSQPRRSPTSRDLLRVRPRLGDGGFQGSSRHESKGPDLSVRLVADASRDQGAVNPARCGWDRGSRRRMRWRGWSVDRCSYCGGE